MTAKEQFYDERVAPVLSDLAKQCKDRGLSLLAVCEWEPGEFGRTLTLREKSGLGIRLADAAAKANGNVDALLIGIIRYAKEHGHSSAYLSLLGVPTTPGERQ